MTLHDQSRPRWIRAHQARPNPRGANAAISHLAASGGAQSAARSLRGRSAESEGKSLSREGWNTPILRRAGASPQCAWTRARRPSRNKATGPRTPAPRSAARFQGAASAGRQVTGRRRNCVVFIRRRSPRGLLTTRRGPRLRRRSKSARTRAQGISARAGQGVDAWLTACARRSDAAPTPVKLALDRRTSQRRSC